MATRSIVHLPPFTIDVKGCLVDILEALEHQAPWGKEYTVSMRIRCGGITTRVFNLTVRNNDELKAKILAEIAKLKIMLLELGHDNTQQIVGGAAVA